MTSQINKNIMDYLRNNLSLVETLPTYRKDLLYKEFVSSLKDSVRKDFLFGEPEMSTSTYPINVSKYKFTKQSKTFGIIELTNIDDKGLSVWVFGKTGVFGEVISHQHPSLESLNDHSGKKGIDLQNKGYKMTKSPSSFTAHNLDDLREALGRPVMSRLGGEALHHIDPDIDPKTIPAPPKVTRGEDGYFDYETQRQRNAEMDLRVDQAMQEVREKQAQEEAQSLQGYKSNPVFGAF